MGNRNIFLKMCSPKDQQNPFACTCILPIYISYTNGVLDLISFDVAPMYKLHLSDTLLKSWYCMYKVCIYDIPQ